MNAGEVARKFYVTGIEPDEDFDKFMKSVMENIEDFVYEVTEAGLTWDVGVGLFEDVVEYLEEKEIPFDTNIQFTFEDFYEKYKYKIEKVLKDVNSWEDLKNAIAEIRGYAREFIASLLTREA